MIKIYLLAVATGLSVALIYGLLVPSLISARVIWPSCLELLLVLALQ